MRSRRWLAAPAALAALATPLRVPLAEEHEPWEAESEGADKVAEVLPLSVVGRTAGHELGQAIKGGPAGGAPQTTPAPTQQTTFFADQELPCSLEKDGELTGCG